MTVETVHGDDGVVRQHRVKPDSKRELSVARVVSLSPPTIKVPGFGEVRVRAITDGLTVAPGDWVLAVRLRVGKREGVAVISKMQLLRGDNDDD
jgi:regulator of RNase E activity RraA